MQSACGRLRRSPRLASSRSLSLSSGAPPQAAAAIGFELQAQASIPTTTRSGAPIRAAGFFFIPTAPYSPLLLARGDVARALTRRIVVVRVLGHVLALRNGGPAAFVMPAVSVPRVAPGSTCDATRGKAREAKESASTALALADGALTEIPHCIYIFFAPAFLCAVAVEGSRRERLQWCDARIDRWRRGECRVFFAAGIINANP